MKAIKLPATGIPPGEWAPCSDRSRERDDPLSGTGGLGLRWLLVEIDGAWGEHAFLESRLDPVVGRGIVRRAEAARMRPVAIRRFGRRADERREPGPTRWAVVDARPGSESVRWGQVDHPADLLELPLDGSTGRPSAEPVFLVCTHARHDRCCAVRGRPVAQALAAAHPDQTWESSHLGGDRFAATMILLPHGLYYGRVPATDAAAIADSYGRGEIVPEYFRGRSAFSTAVQGAQAFARERHPDPRVDALVPRDEHRDESGRWTVRLAHGDGDLVVVLDETVSEPMLSNCGATRPAPVRQFALVSITRVVDP